MKHTGLKPVLLTIGARNGHACRSFVAGFARVGLDCRWYFRGFVPGLGGAFGIVLRGERTVKPKLLNAWLDWALERVTNTPYGCGQVLRPFWFNSSLVWTDCRVSPIECLILIKKHG